MLALASDAQIAQGRSGPVRRRLFFRVQGAFPVFTAILLSLRSASGTEAMNFLRTSSGSIMTTTYLWEMATWNANNAECPIAVVTVDCK